MKYNLTIILILLNLLSIKSEASKFWTSEYDNWICVGKTKIIIDDKNVKNNQKQPNSVCVISRIFKINNDNYTISLRFPNCKFKKNDRELNIKLSKYLKNIPVRYITKNNSENPKYGEIIENFIIKFPDSDVYYDFYTIKYLDNEAFLKDFLSSKTFILIIENDIEVEINNEGAIKAITNNCF